MLLIKLFIAFLVGSFVFIVFFGAPYLPTKKASLKRLFSSIKFKAGSKLVDLGSGDGVVLQIASEYGLRARGIELNPFLYIISGLRLRNNERVKVELGSMWGYDISDADVIFIFQHTNFLPKLTDKIKAEAQRGALVVSFGFEVPTLTLSREVEGFFVYEL